MVSIKQSDVNAMKQEGTKKGCELAFNLMLAIPAMVIHDHYGSLTKKDGIKGRNGISSKERENEQ
ncbi:MAG: hypothetical protein SO089_05540 [Dialister sp.]|nr:hypothetical protein [Dialister sp.]MDY4958035.1 hypothetical protein [Dialister sp.]